MQEAEHNTALGTGGSKPRVSLVVVDSPASLVSPLLGGAGAGPQGHALMVSLGRQLRFLASRFTLAVLSTNHLVGGKALALTPTAVADEHFMLFPLLPAGG